MNWHVREASLLPVRVNALIKLRRGFLGLKAALSSLVFCCGVSGAYGNQQIINFPELVSEDPGAESIEIPFTYSTAPLDLKTSGVRIEIFYDSSRLTFSGLKNLYEFGLATADQAETPFQLLADENDRDGGSLTDSIIVVEYRSSNGTWPVVNRVGERLKLFDIVFSAIDQTFKGHTSVNVVLSNESMGLVAISANELLLKGAFEVCFDCFSLDLDASGTFEPLIDGIILFRHYLRLSNEMLIQDLQLNNPARDEASELSSYLNIHAARLDIDGDGGLGALTDGLLVLRYLFGFRGEALIDSALSAGATRSTSSEIEAYTVSRLGSGVVNQPPSFISLPSTIEVEENQLEILSVIAEDPDGDVLNFSLSGDDESSFNSRRQASSPLKKLQILKTEKPTRSWYRSAIFTTVAHELNVKIIDIEESPEINNLPFSVDVSENQTFIVTVSATDPNGDTLTYSIGGEDADVKISSSGSVDFLSAPDFETKRQYNILVSASDGENVVRQSLRINVLDVNEPPSSIILSSSTVTENLAGALIGSLVVEDPEGDSVTLSLSELTQRSLR